MKRAVLISIGAALFCVVLYAALMQKPHYKEVRVGDTSVQVEVVEDVASQQRGLSGRSSLAEGSGMLFVFGREDTWAFWMKDMRFSIDIIWAASNGEIVHIERSVSPETYPKSFAPPVPARYVLEVPAGFSERHALQRGMRLDIL